MTNNSLREENQFYKVHLLDELPLKKTLEYINVSMDGKSVKFFPESQLSKARQQGREEATKEIISWIESGIDETIDQDPTEKETLETIVRWAKIKFLNN